MTRDQVNHIIEKKAFPYPTNGVELIVTHISWVVLTQSHVYKIKKPVKFSFLDFSTLEKRKLFCEKEVRLNKRLAPGMYLKVIPIKESRGKYRIQGNEGSIVDYAVLMKRMDETKQMDVLVEQGLVEPASILRLADVLARFHQEAPVVPEGEDWEELYREFADLSCTKDFLVRHFDKETGKIVEEVNRWAYRFLKGIQDRIGERNKKGFVIEGHGDLHMRNIFLLENPVIFDCIEFNDDFRKLDLLNEIAFLCMDLERFDRFDLSKIFYYRYLSKIPCIENTTDKRLFAFYKLYRANVRLKIHAINAQANHGNKEKLHKELGLVRQYLDLYRLYYSTIKSR